MRDVMTYKIYNASISLVDWIENTNEIVPAEEKNELICLKYRNKMYDLLSNKCYNILVKENSYRIALGVDYQEIDETALYVTYYKKNELFKKDDLSPEEIFVKTQLIELYNKKSKDLDDLPILYLAKIDHISNIIPSVYSSPEIVFDIPRRKFKIGIIDNNQFISLDDSKNYQIIEELYDDNHNPLVNNHQNIASHLVELELDEIPEEYMKLAVNYSKEKCKLLQFNKKTTYNK